MDIIGKSYLFITTGSRIFFVSEKFSRVAREIMLLLTRI